MKMSGGILSANKLGPLCCSPLPCSQKCQPTAECYGLIEDLLDRFGLTYVHFKSMNDNVISISLGLFCRRFRALQVDIRADEMANPTMDREHESNYPSDSAP